MAQFNLIGKEILLDFLLQIDNKLSKKIKVNCVGGTALTLLNLKNSTKDIDFDLNKADYKIFQETIENISHGLKIDVFKEGLIFSQQLPSDYTHKLITIQTEKKFNNIELFKINPIDIIVSKMGRLNDRDIDDIKICIKTFRLTKTQVKNRSKKVYYIGNEKNYENNLKYVLNNCFD